MRFATCAAGRDEADKIAGLRHARAAIASGTDDATALAVAAFVMGILSKDYKAAVSVIERALSLNPSSAAAHYWGALIHASSGNFAAVTAHANRALRLSPFDPVAFVAHIALGHVAVLRGSLRRSGVTLCQGGAGQSPLQLALFLSGRSASPGRSRGGSRPDCPTFAGTQSRLSEQQSLRLLSSRNIRG